LNMRPLGPLVPKCALEVNGRLQRFATCRNHSGSGSRVVQPSQRAPPKTNIFTVSLLLGSGEPGPTATWLEQQDQWLTVREVAAILRVSRATVYTMVQRRDLGCIRVANAIRIARSTLLTTRTP
jgi:excisionase family DNA binding protein